MSASHLVTPMKYVPSTDDALVAIDTTGMTADRGLLMISDINPVDMTTFRTNPSAYIKTLADRAFRFLHQELRHLPHEITSFGRIVTLPAAEYQVPRAKPAPKEKAMTKWEKYAKEKGVKKKKNSERMVWDEATQLWRPRWGYQRIGDLSDDIILPAKLTDAPGTDPFQAKKIEKKERVARQKLRETKNREAAAKGDKTAIALKSASEKVKSKMHTLSNAQVSTASMGKFDKRRRDEPDLLLKDAGKRRKYEPLISNVRTEKGAALQVLDRMLGKKDKTIGTLNTSKAVHAVMRQKGGSMVGESGSDGSSAKPKKAGKADRRKGTGRGGKSGSLKDKKYLGKKPGGNRGSAGVRPGFKMKGSKM